MLPRDINSILEKFNIKMDLSMRRRGAAWCRKIGTEMASGKYIAFIDDDAIPKEDWLEELLNKMECTKLVGVGGITLSDMPKTLSQYYADLDKAQRMPLTDKNNNIYCISTLNACFLKSALLRSGVIHKMYIEYAKLGQYFWFEDYDITYRIVLIFGTKKLGIAEKAIISHKHRETLFGALKQYYGYGKGAGFWLWCYHKHSSELKGGQEIPSNTSRCIGHIIQVIKAVKYYKGHYLRARSEQNSILFSLGYAIYGWLMRCSFHYGIYTASIIFKKKTHS
jgi:glycosyltransferase involved in cell wall biosynthesis